MWTPLQFPHGQDPSEVCWIDDSLAENSWLVGLDMYQRDLVTGFVSPTDRMDTGNARETLRTTLTTENDIVGMRIVEYDSHNPNRDDNNNIVR